MTYRHAPITEAVIDIRVACPNGFDADKLKGLSESLRTEFPEQQEVFAVEIRGSPETEPIMTRTKVGYRLIHRDKIVVVSAQTLGFGVSKLAPYDRWEAFRDTARPLWDAYRKVVQPEQITRVAVRYVNRIDMPLPLNDFSTYFRTIPEIGAGLPQGLNGFFMQLQIPYEDIHAVLQLNMALTPPPKGDLVSVILDLDLSNSVDIPQGEQELWQYFEQLRLKKNEVFEGCITDETRRLFE